MAIEVKNSSDEVFLSYKINKLKEVITQKLKKRILKNSTFGEPMVFGPIPSRRLGMSLGINNTHKKTCTFDCVYCQAGTTSLCSTCRNVTISPHELYFFVERKLEEISKNNIKIDYITFVPNGEPTLDLNLSREILLLREFGIKIAVFTNGSLLWNKRVQENLLFADYVSIKIDTAIEETWIKINNPHLRLRYNVILEGIKEFSKRFNGKLTTETMFVKDLNDNYNEVKEIGRFVNSLDCSSCFFTYPTRPPSKKYAVPPSEEKLEELEKYIQKEITNPKILFDVCCNNYVTTENIEKEICSILSVHPVNYESLKHIFISNGKNISDIKELLTRGIIKEKVYNGERFFYKGETALLY